MFVGDGLWRRHKPRTRTLPPPSNWCGTPPTPKHTQLTACEAETPTSGCGGGARFSLLGRGTPTPHGLQLPNPPKPRASSPPNLPDLPERARSAPKIITSERKNRQVRLCVCLWATGFGGVINLARAPYHPRPIGVGPHPHPNTPQRDPITKERSRLGFVQLVL